MQNNQSDRTISKETLDENKKSENEIWINKPEFSYIINQSELHKSQFNVAFEKGCHCCQKSD